MPRYEYQCECGMKFEKSVTFANREVPQTCPSCKEKSVPLISRDVNFSFNQKITSPKPPNTGISAYDHKVDRAIGASAEHGWAVHEERTAQKRQLLRENPNSEYGHISRTTEGEYRIMGEGETQEVDNRNKKAIPFIRQRKKKSL